MPSRNRSFVAATVSALVLCLGMGTAAFAQTQSNADNSGTNKTQNQSRTADQQKDNTSDRTTAAKIRRAVVADKSLSMYGHNVKIIVVSGAVTLKGPVHSEQEKQTIGEKAAAIVGQDKVTNQITVKQ